MRTLHNWWVTLGIGLACLAGTARSTAAGHRVDDRASFTVHVSNYAHVDAKELANAEQVAAAIFRKAGVESNWADTNSISSGAPPGSGDPTSARPSFLSVHIQSSSIAGLFGLSNNVMGVAPGAGAGRRLVYVFYDRVEELAQRQVAGQIKGHIAARAGRCQILGEMIAHEIGHVLLDMPSHSETGIMRGRWDLSDLQSVAYGDLLFTKKQSQMIRAELVRWAK